MSYYKKYKDAKLDSSIPLNWDISWYLWGEVGIGKTHNAFAFIIATNKKLREQQEIDEVEFKFYEYPFITFVNWADICDKLRNAPLEADIFTEDTRRDIEHKILHKDRLVIDDLGSEKRSDYTDDFLMRLTEHRYSNDLYTGFTSNNNVPELGYDKRIISRIAGIVERNKFRLSGKDRRIK